MASYKFALGHTLLDLAKHGETHISLETLAEPFALSISRHLLEVDKQGTSKNSRFLDSVRAYNRNEIDHNQLVDETVRRGFQNVIDAFHVVGSSNVHSRFFIDNRKNKSQKGIILTDELFKLLETPQSDNLAAEVEARWNLVERAWEMNISRNMIQIECDLEHNLLFTHNSRMRRVNVTSCRDALNGYQKGACFYCFRDISVVSGNPQLAEVDHFFPHVLKVSHAFKNINGVWNLVLACQSCNRGVGGKFDSIPKLQLLERLSVRNEFLISSHHPLRETLIMQTGKTQTDRFSFLQTTYNRAIEHKIHRWAPKFSFQAKF